MNYQLSELIDMAALQSLMESLYRATGINHALVDNDSRVLSAAGWAPVCTDFHRANPGTCQRCRESDLYILKHLHDAPYVGYDCPNGLVDYAIPVYIEGEHVANIFTGQFFHSLPNLAFFRRQAREFGFDLPTYLDAVQQVPIVPRERMPDIMAFLVGLAQALGQQGLMRLQQAQAKEALRRLNDDLAQRVRERTEALSVKNRLLQHKVIEHQQARMALEQEQQFSEDIINSLPGIFYLLDQHGALAGCNHRFCEVSGYRRDEVTSMHAIDFFDDADAPHIAQRIAEVIASGEETSIEAALLTRAGGRIDYYFSGRRTSMGGQLYLVGLGIDISARKTAEQALRHSQAMLRELADHQEIVREDERKRIARDIHDDLGQNLLALKMDVTTLYMRTGASHPRLHQRVSSVLDNIDATIRSLKLIMNDLRPAALDLGLLPAVEWQLQQFERVSGIACKLVAGEEAEFGLDEVRTSAVFRILQESLTNVSRHAEATEVKVMLGRDDHGFSMKIIDNGKGFDRGDQRKTDSFGLIGIRERTNALGGEFSIASSPDSGTALSLFMAIPG